AALARAGNQLVHPVQAAHEGTLAAPRRADDREHRVLGYLQTDAAQRVGLAKPRVQVLHDDLVRRHRAAPNLPRVKRRAASDSPPTSSKSTSAAPHAFSCQSGYGLTA